MKEKKCLAVLAVVFGIERFDACSGQHHQLLVTWDCCLRGILEIREKREVQVLVSIGEESDFERLDEVIDALGALEERGDDDQRS